jgi:hypothetical protein
MKLLILAKNNQNLSEQNKEIAQKKRAKRKLIATIR